MPRVKLKQSKLRKMLRAMWFAGYQRGLADAARITSEMGE